MEYKNKYTGENVASKPEYMTSLSQNELVYKDHPQIILRGYLDELKSKLLVYMYDLKSSNKLEILDDFIEILSWIKKLQRCEVTGESIDDIKFNNMNTDEIREKSHNPQKYYGLCHLFDLNYFDNIDVLKINEIKAFVRRVEISAYEAFCEEGVCKRDSFIETINRLSSVLYIVELKIISGVY